MVLPLVEKESEQRPQASLDAFFWENYRTGSLIIFCLQRIQRTSSLSLNNLDNDKVKQSGHISPLHLWMKRKIKSLASVIEPSDVQRGKEKSSQLSQAKTVTSLYMCWDKMSFSKAESKQKALTQQGQWAVSSWPQWCVSSDEVSTSAHSLTPFLWSPSRPESTRKFVLVFNPPGFVGSKSKIVLTSKRGTWQWSNHSKESPTVLFQYPGPSSSQNPSWQTELYPSNDDPSHSQITDRWQLKM